MLASLTIKNYALISDLNIRFDAGLNIITGETGAGKSIILDALGLCMGQRADSTVLFDKEKKCVVEAVFDISSFDLKKFFQDNDLDYERLTIIRREITSSGKSRAFINDTPVKLKHLTELGASLIEIHSQYDNLQLFKKSFQFGLIDTLSSCKTEAQSFLASYHELQQLRTQLTDLNLKFDEMNREKEFNQFLFQELEEAQLISGEESELEEEQSLLENAESLIQVFQEALDRLSESEYAVNQQLSDLIRSFNHLGGSVAEQLQERLRAVQIDIEDITSDLNRLANQVEINPDRLNEVNERLALIFNLRSKHRSDSIEQLLEIKESLDNKLVSNSQIADEIDQLKSTILDIEASLVKRARELHDIRSSHLSDIEQKINDKLAIVGMPHSRVKFVLSKIDALNSFGLNELEFQLSSDQGEHYSDIKKSASGGELSRINLIVKNELAKHNSLSTSIFDEIDTGVSGEVARKVGGVMLEMSGNQQIIAVTHLAQIASLGKKHFFVYKQLDENGVSTHVKELLAEERIHEIAKMISGENLTESAIEQSRSLLSN